MSDTPRTDAVIGKQLQDRPEWVDADIARQLERELAEAQRECALLRGDVALGAEQRLRAERAEAERDEALGRLAAYHSDYPIVLRERDEARSEREQMRAATIEECAKVCDELARQCGYINIHPEREYKQNTAANCASWIRALSEPQTEGTNGQ